MKGNVEVLKYIWIFTAALLFTAGCRTYVGSDDVFVSDPPETVQKEDGLQIRRGVILELRDGKYVLTFAEKSLTRQREVTREYYCGRKYYYLSREHKNLRIDSYYPDNAAATFLVTGLALPLQILHDHWAIFISDWHYVGEYPPGWGYRIAYMPVIHLFLVPFLRPPYAYASSRYETEFDDTAPRRLSKETIRDRYIPVVAAGSSQGEVLISCDGKSIVRKISADGKIAFDIGDFPEIRPDGREIEISILHKPWNRRWIIRTPLLVTSKSLRDWNIFADSRYDYPSRCRALVALEPVLGEKRCREYLKLLLNGDLRVCTIPQAKVRIFGNDDERQTCGK